MKYITTCIAICYAILCQALPAQEAAAEQNVAVQAVTLSFAAGALRKLAVQDMGAAVKSFFSEAAQLRWQRLSGEYSEEQLNDFFLGALVLTDGVSARHCGLYNPWWDAVLLLDAPGLPEVPKVERFAFVSGARFRGETGAAADNLSGVVPQTTPLAIELCSLVARTTKYYMEEYQNSPRLFARLQTAEAKDTERIQVRSGVRLQLWLRFLQSKPMQREAKRIARYLQPHNQAKMLKYFTDGGGDFVKAYAALPAELRTRFVPYCYIPGKEGKLMLFFNPDLPRIVITVTLPRKNMQRIMEWFDLAKAEEYLKVWNAQEGAEK